MMNQQAYTPNQPRYDAQTGEPLYNAPSAPEEKTGRDTSAVEVVFAWLALLAGYLFCRVFPVGINPFGGMMFIVGLFCVSAVVMSLKGARFGLMPLLMAGSALLISPALILSANTFLHYLVYLYALAVYCYFVYAGFGNALESGLSDLLPMDFLKAIVIMPFVSLWRLFCSLFSGKFKFGMRSVLKILLGIAIAVIPTAVVVLLLSYDPDFEALFLKFFDFGWGDLFSHTASIFFGIPVAMLIYGIFHSALHHKCANVITAAGCHTASARLKFIPRLTAAAATIPILLVYGIFFASQWEYYAAAFAGKLPQAVSYADFAREGFFQLIAVSVINLLIIAIMTFFTRRSGDHTAPITRILSIVFSVATLLLIGTALAKLVLYVDQFGLTPKRIYAGWFMATLALVFLLIIVKQIALRFRLIPIAVLACVLMVGVLTLSGIDTYIAEYNVDQYLAGDLEELDVEALEDLGDAAVPAMLRAAKAMEADNDVKLSEFDHDDYDANPEDPYIQLCHALKSEASDPSYTLYSFTIPRYRAERALKEAGITPWEE